MIDLERIENRQPSSPRRDGGKVAAWALLVFCGFAALGAYANEPGRQQPAPTRWPSDIATPGAPAAWSEAGRAQLMLFAHSHCPCTRATMGQLDRLVARAGGTAIDAEIHVWFRHGAEEDARGSAELVEHARRIPGVIAHSDPDGVMAARFGAETSGHVVFYDRDGLLRFRGGLTTARGHEGDNAATDSLLELLRGAGAARAEAPVFGCELHDPGRP